MFSTSNCLVRLPILMNFNQRFLELRWKIFWLTFFWDMVYNHNTQNTKHNILTVHRILRKEDFTAHVWAKQIQQQQQQQQQQQTCIEYWKLCGSLENDNGMVFLVCENEDAALVHMTSEMPWNNTYMCGGTDLYVSKTIIIYKEILIFVLLLQHKSL